MVESFRKYRCSHQDSCFDPERYDFTHDKDLDQYYFLEKEQIDALNASFI